MAKHLHDLWVGRLISFKKNLYPDEMNTQIKKLN